MADFTKTRAPRQMRRQQSTMVKFVEAAEAERLKEDAARKKNWKRWGPYLSERQWGTVREDYSADGNCWDHFSHDHARSRAYRWGEDGLLGFTDRQCRICFSVALWNENDPILKERLFGLTGPQGNHGEDCKECYYYLDALPTYTYARALYKYPQAAYPYSELVEGNAKRDIKDPELELEDTGVFAGGRYWDVFAEYSKADDNDIVIKITVGNRGDEPSRLHLLPTLWYRNVWIWGCKHEGCGPKPRMGLSKDEEKVSDGLAEEVTLVHDELGKYRFMAGPNPVDESMPTMLFTENETNTKRLYDLDSYTPHFKDAFNSYVVDGDKEAVSPKGRGTKVAAYYILEVPAGETRSVFLRLASDDQVPKDGSAMDQSHLDRVVDRRQFECDDFYDKVIHESLSAEQRLVARQSYAGLLWSKQFYHYVIKDWLYGDPDQMPPPRERLAGRNSDWKHLFNRDVISMPDKWEYPWYACWDLAFHMIPFAKIDPTFAKEQLLLFLREWYMHPNGQIPAYEFAFGDVNPPVHAWAVWRVFKMEAPRTQRDRGFLARCFQKLLLNFNWWVNRKDPDGKNIFSGGFLGLDNIGVFDRSKPLPTGGSLEQADGTAWMAFFCVVMLDMALELALTDPVYEDMASKFFEHFVAIAEAMNALGDGKGLWNEEDGFYYDHLTREGQEPQPMRIRSVVGLVPLFSVLVLEDSVLKRLPDFHKRLKWFLAHRPELSSQISMFQSSAADSCSPLVPGTHYLLAIPSRARLERVLKYVLDEKEFFSDHGLRSLSKVHEQQPFRMDFSGETYSLEYTPGESNTYLFGGNSNWRGPIWFPIAYLLIESLERYDFYYGDSFQVECPTGSGVMMNLKEVSKEMSRRLTTLFTPSPETGHRPCHREAPQYRDDPHWRDLVLFYEFFHGDKGHGCGASHQTGWTALVTRCLDKIAEKS
eukprot:scpid12923/ scgid35323/ Uncharacterized protein YMR196W